MKNVRVKELEDFSNDFLRKIGQDEDEKISSQRPVKTEVNEDIEELINNNKKIKRLNMPDFSITKVYKKEINKKEPLVIIIYTIILKYYYYSLKMYLNL